MKKTFWELRLSQFLATLVTFVQLRCLKNYSSSSLVFIFLSLGILMLEFQYSSCLLVLLFFYLLTFESASAYVSRLGQKEVSIWIYLVSN